MFLPELVEFFPLHSTPPILAVENKKVIEVTNAAAEVGQNLIQPDKCFHLFSSPSKKIREIVIAKIRTTSLQFQLTGSLLKGIIADAEE
ncbi:hypothetical protein TNCT_127181 [Trichonephila clavata]|uniref:Uncharacterized protein n=1 Tax=Trichonephila clavata TaxID=2740835 RepID=A0A8X6KZ71_TRICU|nr:hypothetical protein TNCT_127181 [Trichonephila clavata]